MALVKLDLSPDRKTLREFGLIALFAFGLLGAWTLYRGHLIGFDLGESSSLVGGLLLGVGIASGLLSLVYPPALRFLYVGLVVVTFPIGLVVSHVVLGLLYYLVITPTGLLMRLFGHDPMHRKLEPHVASYWIARTPRASVKDYFKQY